MASSGTVSRTVSFRRSSNIDGNPNIIADIVFNFSVNLDTAGWGRTLWYKIGAYTIAAKTALPATVPWDRTFNAGEHTLYSISGVSEVAASGSGTYGDHQRINYGTKTQLTWKVTKSIVFERDFDLYVEASLVVLESYGPQPRTIIPVDSGQVGVSQNISNQAGAIGVRPFRIRSAQATDAIMSAKAVNTLVWQKSKGFSLTMDWKNAARSYNPSNLNAESPFAVTKSLVAHPATVLGNSGYTFLSNKVFHRSSYGSSISGIRDWTIVSDKSRWTEGLPSLTSMLNSNATYVSLAIALFGGIPSIGQFREGTEPNDGYPLVPSLVNDSIVDAFYGYNLGYASNYNILPPPTPSKTLSETGRQNVTLGSPIRFDAKSNATDGTKGLYILFTVDGSDPSNPSNPNVIFMRSDAAGQVTTEGMGVFYPLGSSYMLKVCTYDSASNFKGNLGVPANWKASSFVWPYSRVVTYNLDVSMPEIVYLPGDPGPGGFLRRPLKKSEFQDFGQDFIYYTVNGTDPNPDTYGQVGSSTFRMDNDFIHFKNGPTHTTSFAYAVQGSGQYFHKPLKNGLTYAQAFLLLAGVQMVTSKTPTPTTFLGFKFMMTKSGFKNSPILDWTQATIEQGYDTRINATYYYMNPKPTTARIFKAPKVYLESTAGKKIGSTLQITTDADLPLMPVGYKIRVHVSAGSDKSNINYYNSFTSMRPSEQVIYLTANGTSGYSGSFRIEVPSIYRITVDVVQTTSILKSDGVYSEYQELIVCQADQYSIDTRIWPIDSPVFSKADQFEVEAWTTTVTVSLPSSLDSLPYAHLAFMVFDARDDAGPLEILPDGYYKISVVNSQTVIEDMTPILDTAGRVSQSLDTWPSDFASIDFRGIAAFKRPGSVSFEDTGHGAYYGANLPFEAASKRQWYGQTSRRIVNGEKVKGKASVDVRISKNEKIVAFVYFDSYCSFTKAAPTVWNETYYAAWQFESTERHYRNVFARSPEVSITGYLKIPMPTITGLGITGVGTDPTFTSVAQILARKFFGPITIFLSTTAPHSTKGVNAILTGKNLSVFVSGVTSNNASSTVGQNAKGEETEDTDYVVFDTSDSTPYFSISSFGIIVNENLSFKLRMKREGFRDSSTMQFGMGSSFKMPLPSVNIAGRALSYGEYFPEPISVSLQGSSRPSFADGRDEYWYYSMNDSLAPSQFTQTLVRNQASPSNPSLTISETATLRMFRRSKYYEDSDLWSAKINIVLGPKSSSPSGVYNKSMDIYLSSVDPEGILVYTTDNSEPQIVAVAKGTEAWIPAPGYLPVLLDNSNPDLFSVGSKGVTSITRTSYGPGEKKLVIVRFSDKPTRVFVKGPMMGGSSEWGYDGYYNLTKGDHIESSTAIAINKTVTIKVVAFQISRAAGVKTLVVSTRTTFSYQMKLPKPTFESGHTNVTVGTYAKVTSDTPFDLCLFAIDKQSNESLSTILTTDGVHFKGSSANDDHKNIKEALIPLISNNTQIVLRRAGWTDSDAFDISSLYSLKRPENFVSVTNSDGDIVIDTNTITFTGIDVEAPIRVMPPGSWWYLYKKETLVWTLMPYSSTTGTKISMHTSGSSNTHGMGHIVITDNDNDPFSAMLANPEYGNLTGVWYSDYDLANASKRNVITKTHDVTKTFKIRWVLYKSSAATYDSTTNPMLRSRFCSNMITITVKIKAAPPTIKLTHMSSYGGAEWTASQTTPVTCTKDELTNTWTVIQEFESILVKVTKTTSTILGRDYDRIQGELVPLAKNLLPTVTTMLTGQDQMGIYVGDPVIYGGHITPTFANLSTANMEKYIRGHSVLFVRTLRYGALASEPVLIRFVSKLTKPKFSYASGYYKIVPNLLNLGVDSFLRPKNVSNQIIPLVIRYNKANPVDMNESNHMGADLVSDPTSLSPVWNGAVEYPKRNTVVKAIYSNGGVSDDSDVAVLTMDVVELIPPTFKVLSDENESSDDSITLRVYPQMEAEKTEAKRVKGPALLITSPWYPNGGFFLSKNSADVSSIESGTNKSYYDITLPNPLGGNYPDGSGSAVSFADFFDNTLEFVTKTASIGSSPTTQIKLTFVNKPNETELAVGLYRESRTTRLKNPMVAKSDAPLAIRQNFKIKWTVDGTDPMISPSAFTFNPLADNEYGPEIPIDRSIVIKTVVLYPLRRKVANEFAYELKVREPTFTLGPDGQFEHKQKVGFLCETPQSTIYYTTDGTDPVATNQWRRKFIDAVEFKDVGPITIKIIAERTGWTPSDIVSLNVNIVDGYVSTDETRISGSVSYLKTIERET